MKVSSIRHRFGIWREVPTKQVLKKKKLQFLSPTFQWWSSRWRFNISKAMMWEWIWQLAYKRAWPYQDLNLIRSLRSFLLSVGWAFFACGPKSYSGWPVSSHRTNPRAFCLHTSWRGDSPGPVDYLDTFRQMADLCKYRGGQLDASLWPVPTQGKGMEHWPRVSPFWSFLGREGTFHFHSSIQWPGVLRVQD